MVLDNFSDSSRASLERVQRICGKPLTVVAAIFATRPVVEKVLKDLGCTAVIHFAGLKSVLDSVTSPLDYYDNNVVGTHRLLRAMQASHVKRIIFSSSATVYGDPKFLPYTEDHSLNPSIRMARRNSFSRRCLAICLPATPAGASAYFATWTPSARTKAG